MDPQYLAIVSRKPFPPASMPLIDSKVKALGGWEGVQGNVNGKMIEIALRIKHEALKSIGQRQRISSRCVAIGQEKKALKTLKGPLTYEALKNLKRSLEALRPPRV